MPRVKRGTTHVKKRQRLFKKVKGYKWGRKNLIRLAKTAVLKAGVRAYADRRIKKRDRRALWQIKINAFARQHGLSYSKLMNIFKKNNVGLDRKILAQLAENYEVVLAKILNQLKA